MKCIDDEIPFEIPQSWCWVRLAQVLTVKGGKRIPLGDSFSPWPTSHIYIRVTEMKNHTLVANNLKYISDSVYEKIKNYTISKNDLYLTIAGTIGSVGIVPDMFDGMNLTENAVKLTNILVNKMFLVYGISSQFVQSQFAEKTKQMAQPKLAIERILTTLIPLPPSSEQECIVSKIEEIMPIVEKYNKSQDSLDKLNAEIVDKLKKSVLQEAIQGKLVPQSPDDEPASVLLERIKEEKAKLFKEGKLKKKDLVDSVIFKGDDNKYYEKVGSEITCIDEEIPFEIPLNWRWARMGTIGDWGSGSTPQRGNPAYYGGDILWLKTGELNNGVVYDSEEKITDKALQECSLRLNKIGDVLIAMYGATIGKVAIAGREMTTNQACCGCTPYQIYNKYLFHFLIASKDAFIKKGEGGAQPNISREKLIHHLMPIPPIQEQYRIVEKLEFVIASITRR
ncbi:MAG: restriction endonuclease subunit S [Bacteroidales bacterium]|nr:restriction endonuclease subunit S [Bacteroidales bacterium]